MKQRTINKRFYKKLDTNIPKMAVLVGIGYKKTKIEMSDPYDDIHRFYTYLINIGFENNDIYILTDSEVFDNRIEPTDINIMIYLNKLVQAGKTDVSTQNGEDSTQNNEDSTKNGEDSTQNSEDSKYLVFYYTGHGIRTLEKGRIIEGIVPSNFEPNNLIKGSLIKEILIDKLSKNATIFVFIDCCYSGNIISLKYRYHNNKKYLNAARDKSVCNAYVISSSRNNQISIKTLVELDKKNREKRSLLTWAFWNKYKMDTYLDTLLSSIQSYFNSMFETDTQQVQLLTNQDIDITRVTIPELY
jgi:hypothetical protein